MRYSILFFLATTLAAQDELPDFGVKAGLPVSSTSGESAFRWTAGFTGEIHLIWRFSFEGSIGVLGDNSAPQRRGSAHRLLASNVLNLSLSRQPNSFQEVQHQWKEIGKPI
jgi:hypothetical protein